MLIYKWKFQMKKVFSINECFPKLNRQQQGEAWQSIDWKACQSHVDRLQRSISVAMKYGNYEKVHKLRRILYKSKAYNLLCTRRVTQDNQGKRTAGVDKIKLLSPAQRMELVEGLDDGIERQRSPVRQVEIAKR
jgi:RNA-directed DNA polymerase